MLIFFSIKLLQSRIYFNLNQNNFFQDKHMEEIFLIIFMFQIYLFIFKNKHFICRKPIYI